MTTAPLVVIGVGHDGPGGLSAEARQHIAQARVLAGGKRHLAFFPDWQGEEIVIQTDLASVLQQLKVCYRQQKTVALASGDPLFYGIETTMLQLSQTKLLGTPHRLESDSPMFILRTRKL